MGIPTADEWRAAPCRRVLLMGMSGLGKTHLSSLLRASGGWFHYSVDYRIGTRYMGEHIVDNFKREAMRTPFLADLLRSDSIYIASNITFDNLAPLSTYLGKPGDPARGGLTFDEYLRRQDQHRTAEISALLDTGHFVRRARELYGIGNFVCDSGGSICEVVDPQDPDDPVLRHLSDTCLIVWLEGSDAHTEHLVRRFAADPKPMYYQPAFLSQAWTDYLADRGVTAETVDPDDFMRATFARALAHRQPRYAAIADTWGVRVPAEQMEHVTDADGFNDVIARALAGR